MINTEKKQQILENFIYVVIWLILLIVPFIDDIYKQNSSFGWLDIFHTWEGMIPFLLIFLVNNYLLMPLLFFKKKWWLYLASVVVTICLATSFSPNGFFNPHKGPEPWTRNEWKSGPPLPRNDKFKPMDTMGDKAIQPVPRNIPGDNDKKEPFGPHQKSFLRMPFVGFFMNNFIIAILIVGFNIAIKLLFQSIRDAHRLKELEKHNLETELAYLKHQINPHFFMNTLNNIHALIDIDTEKAKETVIGLSKMMRYVLYDSSQPTISLEKEVFFIQNYIELMKLRYTDKVNIKLYLPEIIPSVQIPPLLFISFLENAFKHGISYRKDSYINFSLQVNERDIECLVTNSNCDHISHDNEQGIGLENVRKRLNLLYPDNYTLKIDSTVDEFSVLLIIPLL